MNAKQTWAIFVVTLTLPLLYVAAYLLLLTPREVAFPATLLVGVQSGGRTVLWREPEYRAANDTMQSVFWPANWLDRKLRPDYWGEPWPLTLPSFP